MDLSVIIPIYNTERALLMRCFDSINKIKNIDYEVLLIDDGSKDFVGDICVEYCQQNERYKYFHKKNEGVSSARNFGLLKACGDYFIFVDSDDTINADELTILPNYDIVIYDMALKSDEKTMKKWSAFEFLQEQEVWLGDVVYEIINNNRLNSPCAKVFRKSFVMDCDVLFDTSMKLAEDEDFLIKLLYAKPTIYYQKRIMYYYWRTISTGRRRLKKFSVQIIYDCYKIHCREVQLIERCLNYNVMDIRRANHKYLHELFNLISEIWLIKEWHQNVSETLEEILRPVDCGNLDRISYLKYCILKKKNIPLIAVFTYLREIYLKVRK